MGIQRQPNIHTRTETNQADTLAYYNFLAFLFPAYHATRDCSGDLFENDTTLRRVQINNVLFVFTRGVGAKRSVEKSGAIDYVRNAAGGGRALHVQVSDGKKNADAMAHHGVQHLVDDFDYAAVRGRNDDARCGGNHALRIAEKIKN